MKLAVLTELIIIWEYVSEILSIYLFFPLKSRPCPDNKQWLRGISFTFVYDFDVWFWKCSDNLVFLFYILLLRTVQFIKECFKFYINFHIYDIYFMKCLKFLSCIGIFMHYNSLNAGAGWGCTHLKIQLVVFNSLMTFETSGAGTSYPFGAPEFIPGF